MSGAHAISGELPRPGEVIEHPAMGLRRRQQGKVALHRALTAIGESARDEVAAVEDTTGVILAISQLRGLPPIEDDGIRHAEVSPVTLQHSSTHPDAVSTPRSRAQSEVDPATGESPSGANHSRSRMAAVDTPTAIPR